MKYTPLLHDIYVGRYILMTVLMAWFVLLGLFLMMTMTDQLKDVHSQTYSITHAVAYVAYSAPRSAYNVFPTAAVIGALLGLGQLASSSELTALRALGVSRWRISVSAVSMVAILTFIMAYVGQTFAPWAQGQADTLKINSQNPGSTQVLRYAGLWVREGKVFLNATNGEEKRQPDGSKLLRLLDVHLYTLDKDWHISSITDAAVAEHRKNDWLLKDVRQYSFVNDTVQERIFQELPWSTGLDPQALVAGLIRPRGLSSHALVANIRYRQRNDLDARDFEDQYWSRWFYPFNVLALCLAAIPFSFGSLRSGGMGKRLFLGILFALAFWLLQLFFGRMAVALRLDFRLAYALPPVCMVIFSGLIFRRQQD